MKHLKNLFLFTILLLTFTSCTKRKVYYIQLENTYQLKDNNPVLIKGKQVGEVTNVDLKNGKIIVEITLEPQYPVYKDAVAIIKNVDLLGGKAIELVYSGREKEAINSRDTIAGRYDSDTPLNRVTNKIDTLVHLVVDSAVKTK